MTQDIADLIERASDWAVNDIAETVRDGTFEANDGKAWAALILELVTALRALKAENEQQSNLLKRIEPHIDAIVCYASTMKEHEPNGLALDLHAALAEPSVAPKVEDAIG